MPKRVGLTLCVLLTATTASSADSWIRVTRSVAMTGASQSLSLVETPEGGVATRLTREPQPGRPGEAAERRSERSLSASAARAAFGRVRAEGLLELEDIAQPGIEDAPVYTFEGGVEGRTVGFTVRGLLAEIPDERYRRIFEELEEVCP